MPSIYPFEKGKTLRYSFFGLVYHPVINEVQLMTEFADRVNRKPEDFKAVFTREEEGIRVVITNGDDEFQLDSVIPTEVDNNLEIQGFYDDICILFTLLKCQPIEPA